MPVLSLCLCHGKALLVCLVVPDVLLLAFLSLAIGEELVSPFPLEPGLCWSVLLFMCLLLGLFLVLFNCWIVDQLVPTILVADVNMIFSGLSKLCCLYCHCCCHRTQQVDFLLP